MRRLQIKIPMRVVAKKNRYVPIPVYMRKGPSMWAYMGKKARVALVPDGTYKKFEREIQKIVMSQLPAGFKPYSKPIAVYATFYFDGPEPDTSGCMESIGDALEGVVWENDKLIQWYHGEKYRVKPGESCIELAVVDRQKG